METSRKIQPVTKKKSAYACSDVGKYRYSEPIREKMRPILIKARLKYEGRQQIPEKEVGVKVIRNICISIR